VVGTAHVSAHSVTEVREVIARLAPEVVCVELDRRRHDALTRDSAFRDLDVRKVVREGRALYVLVQVALTCLPAPDRRAARHQARRRACSRRSRLPAPPAFRSS